MYRDPVSEDEIEQLIEDEGKGYAFAGSMLRILAGVRLSTSSSPLDKWIWQLVKKHLKPKKPRSRPKNPPMRDSFIAYAVDLVLARHPRLTPTRGLDTKTEASACSIVADALARAGHPLSEQRVWEIWRQQPR
jgi:hypothetical protein